MKDMALTINSNLVLWSVLLLTLVAVLFAADATLFSDTAHAGGCYRC